MQSVDHRGMTAVIRLLIAAIVAMQFTSAIHAAEAVKPNIVIILSDDQGRGDYSAFGTKDIRTPGIDRLYAEGMGFDNFFANCPVCSPTRGSDVRLLSGSGWRAGVIRDIKTNSWGYLAQHATLLPKVLKTAGYHSAIVGKWHLGLEPENLPLARGFDHFHGFLDDMMDDYYTHLRNGHNFMRRDLKEIDPEGHATDLFTQWACDYIRERAQAGGPFLLYLAYNAPHDPVQPKSDWLAKVKTREPNMPSNRQKLVALIEHMDDGIGQVLRTLDETKLAANTMVCFSSDNGGILANGANNGPYRGGKQMTYDGGLRVPFAIRWPARIKPGTTSARRALTMDIYATACEVSGVTPPKDIDGVSFLPTLLGQEQPDTDRAEYFVRREGGPQYGGKTIEALRMGDWKLVLNSPFAPAELFNVKADPAETTDLASREKKKFLELSAELRRHIQRGGQVPWQKSEQ